MAAAKGNQYARNGRLIRNAIKRALAHEHGSVSTGLTAIANATVKKASEGDANARDSIFDRLAGKAHQTVDAQVNHTVDFKDADNLQEKLTRQHQARVGEPAEPPKRTIQ